MKRFTGLVVAALFIMILHPVSLWSAQAAAKKSLPQVPITYAGDTDGTVMRRAQWIEGAQKEGGLAWWGSGNNNQIKEISAEFNKIYPFIKVNYWRGQDMERVTRLETENSTGHVSVDIMEGGAPENFPRWRKAGIPARFTSIIPGVKKWERNSYSRHEDWVMPENTPMVPMYNTKLISPADAPKSWEDLLDPKFKGKIGLSADMKAWYMLALDEKGWGIKKTEAFLTKLKQQNPVWTSGHSAGHSLMIAGEFPIMGEDYFRYIFKDREKGAPVDWVRVNIIPVPGSYYFVHHKAPHPNSVNLFAEWLFSPQGLDVIEKVTGKGACFPGADTRQAKELAGATFIYKSEEMIVKAKETGLIDKFANILGVTPE